MPFLALNVVTVPLVLKILELKRDTLSVIRKIESKL